MGHVHLGDYRRAARTADPRQVGHIHGFACGLRCTWGALSTLNNRKALERSNAAGIRRRRYQSEHLTGELPQSLGPEATLCRTHERLEIAKPGRRSCSDEIFNVWQAPAQCTFNELGRADSSRKPAEKVGMEIIRCVMILCINAVSRPTDHQPPRVPAVVFHTS